jgi:hypothetical protein
MPCPNCYSPWGGLNEAGHLFCTGCDHVDPVELSLKELVARFIETDSQLASVKASREFYFQRYMMHLRPADHSSRNTSPRTESVG